MLWLIEKLKIKTTDRLLNCIDKRKLTFLGHVVRRDGLGKNLITGMLFGKRKRGRPKTRYKDSIRELTKWCKLIGLSIGQTRVETVC